MDGHARRLAMRSISLAPILLTAALACACERADPDRPAAPAASAVSAVPAVSAPRPTPPPPARPAGPAELALVAPLVPGARLENFEVREVRAVESGVLTLVLAKERAIVRLSVALAEDAGPAPPALAGRYAIFYSLRNAQPEDGERLARALARILDKHADVPAPPGLSPFVPSPIPI
jgi:hypothetical protein